MTAWEEIPVTHIFYSTVPVLVSVLKLVAYEVGFPARKCILK